MEIDPVALDIAQLNPWSRELFDNPSITQIVGDIKDEIADFQSGIFSIIIHDPPAFSLAGSLYSGELYGEFYRVLRPHGKVFH